MTTVTTRRSKQFKQWDKSCWVFITNIPENEQCRDFAVSLGKVGLDCIERAGCQKPKNFKKPVVNVPYNDDNNSRDSSHRGFAIMAFRYPKEAQFFGKNWNKHNELIRFRGRLNVYLYWQYEELMRTPEKFKKLKFDQFVKDRDIYYWLKDEKGAESFRDQYITRFKENGEHQTIVYWFNEHIPNDKREVEYDHSIKSNTPLTQHYVQWSNTGIYLATFHPRGIQLWGGPKWQRLAKLAHPHADYLDFSPDDKYLITCNVRRKNKESTHMLIIWNTLNGEEIRSFSTEQIGPSLNQLQKGYAAWWPIFRWSGDSKYLCKVDSTKKQSAKPKDFDKLTIFCSEEQNDNGRILPEFSKLGKKSLKTPNLYDFKLSPEKRRKVSRNLRYSNYLAYTQVAQQNSNTSGNLVLMELPSKKILKTQSLGFDAGRADVFWNYNADFVAVKISHIEGRRTTFKNQKISKNLTIDNSIGILSTQLQSMPFHQLSNLPKTTIFEWEPRGNRFGILHGDLMNPNVSIYEINRINRNRSTFNVELILRCEKRKANCIKWAPHGSRLCIAWLEPQNKGRDAKLEFVLDLYNPQKNVVRSHNGANNLEWCPSGRYLISACTSPHLNATGGDDTGFIVWDWQGNELYRNNLKFFYQILWRPRPKIRLSREDEEEIKQRINPSSNKNNQIDNVNDENQKENWNDIFSTHDRKIKLISADKKIKENRENDKKWKDILQLHRKKNISIENDRTKMRNGYAYSYTNSNTNDKHENNEEKINEPRVSKQIVEEKETIDYQERILSKITAHKIIYGKEEYDIKYIDQLLSEEDEDEMNNNTNGNMFNNIRPNGNQMQSNQRQSNSNSIRIPQNTNRNTNPWGNRPKMFG